MLSTPLRSNARGYEPVAAIFSHTRPIIFHSGPRVRGYCTGLLRDMLQLGWVVSRASRIRLDDISALRQPSTFAAPLQLQLAFSAVQQGWRVNNIERGSWWLRCLQVQAQRPQTTAFRRQYPYHPASIGKRAETGSSQVDLY